MAIWIDLSATSSQIVTDEYKVKTYGGSLNAAYPLTQFWTFRSKYRARYADMDASSDLGVDDGKDKEKRDRNDSKENPAKKQVETNGNISAISVGINYDSTEARSAPTKASALCSNSNMQVF